MIKAIFYGKFDPQEGPKVVHQVPDGAIVPSATAPSQSPFLTFSDISFFVIPRQELCGNLIQVCTGGYRILGYPICMRSARYERNEFIFNFCLVLAEEEDFSTYKSVVQKLADLMHGLEEQNGFLYRDLSKSGEGKIYSLCETLMEDLNNYCECMIPIDELNTLNIKLFPVYPAPAHIKAWHVPLFTVRYQTFMDENWDLTMQRIVPHINGVNSVRIISVLADTDFSLTCRAVRHLLYYGCLFLLDIFSFSAIYAPTAQFSSTIASDEEMQRECARYVNTLFATTTTAATFSNPPRSTDPDAVWPPIEDPTGGGTSDIASSSGAGSPPTSPLPSSAATVTLENNELPHSQLSTIAEKEREREGEVVDGVGLVELYASLKQGQSIKQWYMQHTRQLAHIDIRRFITFGVIKGFLYRVHKYAYATGLPAPPIKSSHHAGGGITSGPSSRGPGTGTNSPYATSAGEDPAPIEQHSSSLQSGSRTGPFNDYDDDDEDYVDDKTLSKYLDGMHCFDQICTELEISEKDLTARLKRYHGEVMIIHR